MWGGAVESETSGGASAAAWGAAVGASSGGDATAAGWMSGGNGGQSGWAGGGCAKTGWDTQQQPNLVPSSNTGGQPTGPSWQSGSNGVTPTNGWGGSTNAGPTNWNAGTGQQWTGTSPGGGSTWAGVAGRHAPTTSTAIPQTPVQQGSVSMVTAPTAVAVRPKGGFEGVGWGKPVDQGTPWEVRQAEGAANWAGGGGGAGWNPGVPQHSNSGGNLNPNSGGNLNPNSGGNLNPNSGGNLNREGSWQGAPVDNRDAAQSYGGYGGGKVVRPVGNTGPTDSHHWGGPHGNVAGGSGWDAIPAQRHSSSSGMWNASGGMEHQREAAPDVWTGPPAPPDVADSHMIWTNPFPKKKTAQPDKGTNAWGDPTSQGDIKRWKTNNEGDLLPALTVLQATSSSNAQQAQSTSGTGSSNSGTPTQPTQTPTPAGGGWKDSPTPTPQQQQPPKTPSWNSENVGPASISSPASSGSGWGDPIQPANVPSGGSVSTKATPYDRDVIQGAGWGNSGTKQGDPSRNSMESDGGNVSDDVFSSNPTTPLSAGTGPPGSSGPMMILNKQQQQQLPNGLGPQGNNPNLSQLVAEMTNAKLAGQNVQMQNLPYNANRSSMTNNSAGRVAQELLTQQIADQLKAAVQAGLIDPNILHQPLPQETLLRLNQLLQCVPKLEQAQKEMLQLQNQAANQPQGFTVGQQQEFQRISNQVKQLRQTMATLKQAIIAQTQCANNGNGQQQMRNGPASAGNGDGGQSKLEQWKRGSTNGVVNGVDSGSGVFGVGLPGNPNDPWSNTPAKRNSGADWPQSAPTTPGDMPKSPDKQNDGNKENENQQNGDGINRASPSNIGSSGNDSTGGAGLTTPTLLDDVPEFKPGQPWNWRDPKELAEDPDATPGSIKRPTLLNSVSSIVNSSDMFGTNSTANHGVGDLGGAGALAAGISAMNFGGNSAQMMGGGGFANYGASGVLPSSFYGQPKTAYDMAKMSGPGFGGRQQSGFGDSWPPNAGGMPRASRPPSQMGQPIGGRAPFKHSMSTPNNASNVGYMPPYNMGNAAPVQWVVLTNLNMMDEQSLQMMLARIAPVSSCIYPAGTGFAVVKFKDISLDNVLPRLQQECANVGVTIQLAKDDEVSRLIQAVTGQRAGSGPPSGHQGGGGSHMFGPPPPPHHPGAMGPAIWDAPPPHPGGPWGPPPPQASGLHHHGGGPFAPHHAALADPTVAAAAAMSMAMPPGMHDGLFGPVGHDRHAPF